MRYSYSKRMEDHKRADLAGEHRLGDKGQIIIACIFSAVWISDSFFLKYTTFMDSYIPSVIKLPLGITFLTMAAFLSARGLYIVFGEKRDEPAVIEKDVFGVIRHPIYLSEILLYIGLIMLRVSLAAIGIWIGGIIFLHYIARYEEKLLLERFGSQYKEYMRRVPMWVPRFHRN